MNRRILIPTLVILVLILGLAPLLLSRTPRMVSVGRNIRLDNYAGMIGDLHGVEPYVAVGKDGTIHVAWIGLNFSRSATYYDEGPRFQTRIWYSTSSDNGLTFSNPTAASPWGSNFDPSIALTPEGEVLIAYVEVGGDVIVAKKANQNNSFQQIIAVKNPGYSFFDRPWIAASRNGTAHLVWYDPPNVLWATSTNGGVTFSTPMQVGQPTLGRRNWWPAGLTVDGNDTVHITMLGWSFSATKPDQVWYARKPAGTGIFQVMKLATIQSPYPLDFEARMMSHPGPAIAAEGNRVLVAYVSDSGNSLYVTQSNDDGLTWNTPFILRSSSAPIQMPWLAMMEENAVVAWRENADGSWNTYYAKYAHGTSITPIKVSDQKGYAGAVLNWHGDFLGIASIGTDKVVVSWSDGRNLPMNYGYGHVYVAIVQSYSSFA